MTEPGFVLASEKLKKMVIPDEVIVAGLVEYNHRKVFVGLIIGINIVGRSGIDFLR